MAEVAAQLQSLVDEPHEALNIEVKRWLDLAIKDDQATLAKAAIALANHGGGFIVLGFEEQVDGSFESHLPRPASLEGFSPDTIARIVATYAEPAFQVEVSRIARQHDRTVHIVIQVPGGHRTPIMAKKGSPDQKTLIASRVYIRRPTPESAEPGSATEWRELLDRCVRAGRGDLLDAIRGVLDGHANATVPSEASSLERLEAWRAAGLARWQALVPADQAGQPNDSPGIYTVVYQMDGEVPKRSLPEMVDLLGQIRGYTGWRPWWVPTREGIRPYPFDDVVECYLGAEGDRRTADPAHADFWRVSPAGQLLLIRGFQEDAAQDRHTPGTVFDLVLPVWRMGECLLHAEAYTALLCQGSCLITFKVTWQGLQGRELVAMEGRRMIFPGHIAKQDSLTRQLTVSSDQISDRLPELVYDLVQPLYALFDFFQLPKALVDEELHRLRAGR